MARSDVTGALTNRGTRPIIIATHARSGTHLTIDLFRRQFRACQTWKLPGYRLTTLYLPLEQLMPGSPRPLSDRAAQRILSHAERPLIKTHYPWGFGQWCEQYAHHPRLGDWVSFLKKAASICYVYRDGRDTMCSYHLFKQRSDPSARCSLSEFLRQTDVRLGVSRSKSWAMRIKLWLQEPSIIALRFEEIVNITREQLARIGQKLELKPLYVEPLLPRPFHTVWQRWWAELTQPRPESTAHLGRHKGQKPLAWREAFTLEDREFFHQEAGDMLIRLGYEQSDDWVDTSHKPPSPTATPQRVPLSGGRRL